MIYTIYKITNQVNGRAYIGYTKNPEYRWWSHKNDAKRGSEYVIHRAMRKYGIESFTFEIIYQSTDGEHCQKVMEPYFIQEYRTFAEGYNMTLGGEGFVAGYTHSEASLEKMRSEARKPHRIKTSTNNLPERYPGWTNAGSFKPGQEKLAKAHKWSKGHPVFSTASQFKPGRIGTATPGSFKKGQKPTHKGEKVDCPHCGAHGGFYAMKRWHFDHCKARVQS